jgi:hypothetical protein
VRPLNVPAEKHSLRACGWPELNGSDLARYLPDQQNLEPADAPSAAFFMAIVTRVVEFDTKLESDAAVLQKMESL